MRALTTSTQASGVGRDDARYRPERVVDGVGAQVIAPVIVPLVSDGGSTLSSEDAAQGGAAAPDKGATRTAYTVERLRQKIWQMVFQAQSRLSQGCAPTPTQTLAVTHAGRRRRAAGCSRVTQRSGRGGGGCGLPRYTSMLVQAGDFQYSYALWFEDADGNRWAARAVVCGFLLRLLTRCRTVHDGAGRSP